MQDTRLTKFTLEIFSPAGFHCNRSVFVGFVVMTTKPLRSINRWLTNRDVKLERNIFKIDLERKLAFSGE